MAKSKMTFGFCSGEELYWVIAALDILWCRVENTSKSICQQSKGSIENHNREAGILTRPTSLPAHFYLIAPAGRLTKLLTVLNSSEKNKHNELILVLYDTSL